MTTIINPWSSSVAGVNAYRYTETAQDRSFHDEEIITEEEVNTLREYWTLKHRWNMMSNKERQVSVLKQRLEELTSDVINMGASL